MKKLVTIFITILLITTLVSCGNNSINGDLPDVENADSLESERILITLGIIEHQLHTVDHTTRYVSQFNRENRQYRIEIVNYSRDDLMRLHTELIAGSGPDIIYSLNYEDSIFTPMKNNGVLADLWPFIDADPDINREDFFQNILEAKQSPDGSLQLFANQFTINTLVSSPETIDYAESFTTTKFLELIRNALDAGLDYPVGEHITGIDFFVQSLVSVDLGLIDIDSGISHLESQVFYDLLEITSLLPSEINVEPVFSLPGRMARGEQIFDMTLITSLYSIVYYKTFLGDFSILGYPSDAGGVHGANMMSNIGLTANSDNPEAAWSFIRKYLLHDIVRVFDDALHLRIDLFDDQVREVLKIHELRITADEESDGMMVTYTEDGEVMIPIRSLTEECAIQLRDLVESVSFISRLDDTIINILLEELPQFLDGRRTKEETVRIMQNRVQMYLDERN